MIGFSRVRMGKGLLELKGLIVDIEKVQCPFFAMEKTRGNIGGLSLFGIPGCRFLRCQGEGRRRSL